MHYQRRLESFVISGVCFQPGSPVCLFSVLILCRSADSADVVWVVFVGVMCRKLLVFGSLEGRIHDVGMFPSAFGYVFDVPLLLNRSMYALFCILKYQINPIS